MDQKKALKSQNEVGFVIEAKNYLYYLEGLPTVKVNDIIISGNGARALVVGLHEDKIEALMLDRDRPKPGEVFTIKEGGLNLPPGDELIGRAINPLGFSLDRMGNVEGGEQKLELDVIAPGVDSRELITGQLETGITLVDTMLPIAKGQRELIYGEPRSGKTGFLLDIVKNQKNKNIICIYAGIGKSEVDLKKFVQGLSENGSLEYTIVLGATSSESAPVIYITPSVAMGIADQFRADGRDVLVILDDLGKQAKYIREISLLAEHVPGRESYPGDIFYQHAHIIERAGSFNELVGGGSVTMLPVIETDLENFTALIPTNLMASTDGHLLFVSKLRSEGRYPAIDIDRSVTRVGKQTQSLAHKILADRIRMMIASYEDLRRYSRFGADVSDETKLSIKKGQIIIEFLKQEPGDMIEIYDQMVMMALIFTTFFDQREIEFVYKNKPTILETVRNAPEFIAIKQEAKSQIDKLEVDHFIERVGTALPVIENSCHS